MGERSDADQTSSSLYNSSTLARACKVQTSFNEPDHQGQETATCKQAQQARSQHQRDGRERHCCHTQPKPVKPVQTKCSQCSKPFCSQCWLFAENWWKRNEFVTIWSDEFESISCPDCERDYDAKHATVLKRIGGHIQALSTDHPSFGGDSTDFMQVLVDCSHAGRHALQDELAGVTDNILSAWTGEVPRADEPPINIWAAYLYGQLSA